MAAHASQIEQDKGSTLIMNLVQAMAFMVGWFTALPFAYQFFMAMLAFDIVTGLGVVFMPGTGVRWDGTKALRGAWSKAALLFAVFFADYLGQVLPRLLPGVEIQTSIPIGVGVTLVFAVREAMSVMRNFTLLGVSFPEFIVDAFGLLRDRYDPVRTVSKTVTETISTPEKVQTVIDHTEHVERVSVVPPTTDPRA